MTRDAGNMEKVLVNIYIWMNDVHGGCRGDLPKHTVCCRDDPLRVDQRPATNMAPSPRQAQGDNPWPASLRGRQPSYDEVCNRDPAL